MTNVVQVAGHYLVVLVLFCLVVPWTATSLAHRGYRRAAITDVSYRLCLRCFFTSCYITYLALFLWGLLAPPGSVAKHRGLFGIGMVAAEAVLVGVLLRKFTPLGLVIPALAIVVANGTTFGFIFLMLRLTS